MLVSENMIGAQDENSKEVTIQDHLFLAPANLNTVALRFR